MINGAQWMTCLHARYNLIYLEKKKTLNFSLLKHRIQKTWGRLVCAVTNKPRHIKILCLIIWQTKNDKNSVIWLRILKIPSILPPSVSKLKACTRLSSCCTTAGLQTAAMSQTQLVCRHRVEGEHTFPSADQHEHSLKPWTLIALHIFLRNLNTESKSHTTEWNLLHRSLHASNWHRCNYICKTSVHACE